MEAEAIKKWRTRLGIYVTIIGAVIATINVITKLKAFKQYPQLGGSWKITFNVKESSFKPYINDVYVYEVYVTQTENVISGNGEQKLYNGNYARSHFKIHWDKTMIDNKMDISYFLDAHRSTAGIMNLKMDSKDKKHLIGTFHGAAASVRGLVDVYIE